MSLVLCGDLNKANEETPVQKVEEKPKAACTIFVRQIMTGDDYNRVVSVTGKLPKIIDQDVICGYSILTKENLDKLSSNGVEVIIEDLRQASMIE